MTNDRWADWIRRQLRREPIEPASEEFYKGVWKLIAEQESSLSLQNRHPSPAALESTCWKAAPILAGLLLAVLLYGWFFPPEMNGRTASSIDSYVWDAAVPGQEMLIYQILDGETDVESEVKP